MQFVECTSSYQSLMTYSELVAHRKAKRLREKLGVPFYTQQIGERHKICLDYKDVEIKIADISPGLTVEFF